MNAVVTVVGMFAFVGTAYVTSIRLTAIQGFTPLKASVAFVFLSGLTLVQMPLTSRLLERYNPKWVLGGGFALIGAGDLWLAAVPATNLSLAAIVAPLVIAGIGFALAVSSVTAVAVNAMPNHLAGMASGTTNMLRDLGFGLGPAVIGAVALSQAAAQISRTVAGSASLRGALAGFTASAAHAPAAQRPALEAAVRAVQSGPLGANASAGDGARAWRPRRAVQPAQGRRLPRPQPCLLHRLRDLRSGRAGGRAARRRGRGRPRT